MPLLKTCGVCGGDFPATTEFWHKHKQGLKSECKVCACAMARQWYNSHPDRVRINHENSNAKRSAQRAEKRRIKEAEYVAPTHRVCNVCREEFPRTAEFWPKQPRRNDGLDETCKACAKQRAREWYAANRERGIATRREYSNQHQEQLAAASARYRKANEEKVRAKNLELYQRNREKRIAYSAQWRLDHPEKAAASRKREYENNAEAIKQRAKDWVKANRERSSAGKERRRAIRKGAPGAFTKDDLIKQHQLQEGKCFYCSVDMQNAWTVDHYIPLSKGGTNFPDNIKLACAACNNSKRAKLPADFKPKSASI